MFLHLKEVRSIFGNRHLRDVHLKAVDAVDRLTSCEAEVIRCLQEVDSKLVYRYLGYGSLYRYSVEALRLSEYQAYAFMTVARRSIKLPKLQQAIESGELTVSKAVRLSAVINEENQAHWIGLATHLTKNELEKKIAEVNPRTKVKEGANYLSGDMVAVRFPMAEENYKHLKRAQDLLCQSEGRVVTLEETVGLLADFFLERKDPVLKAKRAGVQKEAKARRETLKEMKNETSNDFVEPDVAPFRVNEMAVDDKDVNTTLAARSDRGGSSVNSENGGTHEVLGPGRVARRKRRRALNARVVHALNLRDQRRCQHRMPNGSLCNETRWLQVHHRVEVCNGGTDHLDNLVTLCNAHHSMRH